MISPNFMKIHQMFIPYKFIQSSKSAILREINCEFLAPLPFCGHFKPPQEIISPHVTVSQTTARLKSTTMERNSWEIDDITVTFSVQRRRVRGRYGSFENNFSPRSDYKCTSENLCQSELPSHSRKKPTSLKEHRRIQPSAQRPKQKPHRVSQLQSGARR